MSSSTTTNTMQVFVRTLSNQTLTINISSNATVNELKDFIYIGYNIPIKMQYLYYQDRLLKDNRKLSYYKINDNSSMKYPLLLKQIFNINVFISKKVLSLYSLSNDDNNNLAKQNFIECDSNSSVNLILKELNLFHLSHLLKVCVGAGSDDIRDFDKKIVDIADLLKDGILSILFSARWFIDRTQDITYFSHLMSETIQKSTKSAKDLKACLTFAKLDNQFEQTQAFILKRFEEIDSKMTKETKEINRAWKWVKKLSSSVQHKSDQHKSDQNDAQKLLTQLQNKVENIDRTLKTVKKKWIKKRKQIILYLQKSVRETETDLMKDFKSWLASDIVQWLQYMDDRILFDNDIISKFVNSNINGYNLSDINDLSLKLMGINSIEIRKLIISYIDTLLTKYGKDICHSPYCNSSGCDTPCSSENDNDNLCCICATNNITTVIVPCGHSVYCGDCSLHENIKHSIQCPICRGNVESIITVYKAGLQFSQ